MKEGKEADVINGARLKGYHSFEATVVLRLKVHSHNTTVLSSLAVILMPTTYFTKAQNHAHTQNLV